MKLTEQESILEGVLFVSGSSLPFEAISNVLGVDVKEVAEIVRSLSQKYAKSKRGILIVQAEDTCRMCTNPLYFPYIQKIYEKPQKRTLTPTLLETLAVIAYKQPVTKGDIEKIRGVNADHAVNKLMEYGLASECGRRNTPGRPLLFGTSEEFLHFFGFENISDMPPLDFYEIENYQPDISEPTEKFVQIHLDEIENIQKADNN